MNDTPFTTHGDEALEARIVSWVLGEASAFEAAELERLCEERPELMVFKRRMRALHGLLTESEKQQPDEGWKLPEDKRRALDELFGEPAVIRLEAERERRVKHSGRRALLAIAACVVLTLVVLSLLPGEYEAAATIEIKPRTGGMSPSGMMMTESSGANRTTPQFFATEFEKIKSRNNLEQVVENLELVSRWGVDKETALKRVKESIETENLRGTDLVSIRVRHSNKVDARDIADEVTKAYKAYRNEIEQSEAERQLAELNKAVRDQEDKVEERRKVLATIVRTKGIIYRGQDSFYGQSGADEDLGAKTAQQVYHELEQEKMQTESQLESLQKFSDEQQMVYASGLNLPNNAIRHLYPQYIDAKRQLDGHKINGLSEKHPTVAAANEQIEKLKKDLDKEVVNLRSTLKSQLDLTNERLKSVELARNETKEEAIKKGLDAQDYVDAKREFENDQELLQQMKLKKTAEEISLRIPRESVQVHDEPIVKASPNPIRAAAEKLGGFFAGKDTAVASSERASKTESLPGARGMIVDGRVAGGQSGERMHSLQTTIPRELIEGTPKPMNVPNLEMPVNGPAGSSSWSAASRGAAAPADSGVVASRAAAEAAPTPAAPAAPAAEVIAGKTASNVVVPVPEQKLQDGSLAFGDASDFGGGWGGGGAGEVRFSRVRDGAEYLEGADAMAQEGHNKGASSDPIRSNAALTYEHQQKVDEVRRDLYQAEGNYNLGKFDEAKREYENVLRTDPYNQAARRGMEKIASAKSDYYRAAYDHTRAELLAEVDKSWELAVPAEKAKEAEVVKDEDLAFYSDSKAQEPFNANVIDGKPWSGLAQRELTRRRAANEADESASSSNVDRFYTYTGYRQSKDSRVKSTDDASALSLDPAVAARQQWFNEHAAASKVFGLDSGETEYEIHTGYNSEYAFRAPESLLPKESDAQPSLVDLMQEVSAAEDPFSTFSLNISDASFQVAQAAMAKGERPDPAGVKVEQFYNAVDYGDPAPANGEPVAVSIGQVAHPVIPGRNLVRIALKTAASGRSAAQPLRLTLLVDQSGSMSREDRRAAMDKALAGLGGLLTGNDLVTVIGFSRTPRLLADGLTGDKANTLPQLVNQSASEGGTNLEQAIDLAAQLSERRKQAGAQNRIVLFTDGAANLGNADPEKLAARVRELRQKGIAFDIAGIVADGLNDELLGELARNGNGRYYVVGKGGEETFAKQLAGAFRPAAENVKVQVRFNPERVARYKLIGFEKDRLKTEDFRNDAVDAAELAAEEAGVAIYQVEPIPNGRGEIGEVSVRFRDTAAAAMVERSWTVSYDADAPAIDRAPPSMQLATLAMLAAEKLKGGPLAEAIDFKQLTTPTANVKQHYGNHGRPAEVLRMVDALK